jgi:hypothetical protein
MAAKKNTKNLPFAEQYKQVMRAYVDCSKVNSEVAIAEFEVLLEAGEANGEERVAAQDAIRVQKKLIVELQSEKYTLQKNEGVLRRLLGGIGKIVRGTYTFLRDLARNIGRGIWAAGRWAWDGAKAVVMALVNAAKYAFWTVVSITSRGVDFVLEVTSTLIAQGIHLMGGTLADLNRYVREPVQTAVSAETRKQAADRAVA